MVDKLARLRFFHCGDQRRPAKVDGQAHELPYVRTDAVLLHQVLTLASNIFALPWVLFVGLLGDVVDDRAVHEQAEAVEPYPVVVLAACAVSEILVHLLEFCVVRDACELGLAACCSSGLQPIVGIHDERTLTGTDERGLAHAHVPVDADVDVSQRRVLDGSRGRLAANGWRCGGRGGGSTRTWQLDPPRTQPRCG